MRSQLLKYFLRSIRWFVVSLVFKKFVKRKVASTVDKVVDGFDDEPSSVVNSVVSSLPTGAKKSLGSAVVASRSVKKVARSSAITSKFAFRGLRKISTSKTDLQSKVSEAREAVGDAKRQIKSEYLAVTKGSEAATDALLDLRETSDNEYLQDDSTQPKDIADISQPVRKGRRKARPSKSRSSSARVQNTYRKPQKPWE